MSPASFITPNPDDADQTRGGYRVFPNFDGDECGEVSIQPDGGREMHANWCHQAGKVRILTASGLAENEPRDPQWGSPEDQARRLLHICYQRVLARTDTRPRFPPAQDGWLDPKRLP